VSVLECVCAETNKLINGRHILNVANENNRSSDDLK